MLKGHHWDNGTVTKEPTCTEPGEMIYHCTDENCNESYTETIKATGHQHTKLINKKIRLVKRKATAEILIVRIVSRS